MTGMRTTAAAHGVLRTLWAGLVMLAVGAEPRRPGRRRQWPLLVAALLALLFALGSLEDIRRYVGPSPPFAPLIALLITLPVVLLVRWPLMAWRLALLSTLALNVVMHTPSLPWLPLQIVIYLATLVSIGLRRPRVVLGLVWALSMVLLWLFAYTPEDNGNAIGGTVVLTLLTLASGGIGALLSARRELAGQTRRTRDEQARRTLLEERARIARELHDVVAHHMSLIAVQAETARYRLPDLSADVQAEFGSISGASREALVEMRRLLGVLRSEPAPASAADAPTGDAGGQPDQPARTPELAPQPGLADLDDLLDRVRRAGTEVTLRRRGRPGPVAPGVDLSAYRVVQESLSNARRHAPGTAVLVEVEYDPDAVRVVVGNGPPTGAADGPTPAPDPGTPGHGLLGMRERAAMLGGTLTAGPTARGGFEVVAVLPRHTGTGGADTVPVTDNGEDQR